jgi:DNA topoisomerase I
VTKKTTGRAAAPRSKKTAKAPVRGAKKTKPAGATPKPRARAKAPARVAARPGRAGRTLLVVESPAKAKTIQKFLGPGYVVRASMGHVRDLPKNPKKKGEPDWIGVDEDRDFAPHYVVLRDKKKAVDEIVAAARNAPAILLAADPDREGEAICWHLEEILRGQNVEVPIGRVLFHEITRNAVQSGIASPQPIAMERVDAQQTRRILDRIVGYRLSPLLWDKVRRGLSAGRVQTVALRMIVEREREIRDFRAVEYWTVSARLQAVESAPFEAKLIEWRGTSVPWQRETEGGRSPALPDAPAAAEVEAHLKAADFTVAEVEAKRAQRTPPPPFTTSKLQQEAARRFGWTVRRTMQIAQGLYEGKDLGDQGTVGLITYMRTDSVRVAAEALDAARAHVASAFGPEYLPEKPRFFRQRKSVQDAHEAIRPTSLDLPPERVAGFLDGDARRLYTLIWNRFVASQMAPAEFDVTRIDIRAGDALLRATGEVMRFPGWRRIYEETRDEGETAGEAPTTALPALTQGDALTAREILTAQNFTQPPSRYTEAMLVRALEENGIGRPSTYASILSVLSDQDYVDKEEGRFRPSHLGEVVVDLLLPFFGDIFEIRYTAGLEEELDRIEEGETKWVDTLRVFAAKFGEDLQRARLEMPKIKELTEKTDEVCQVCGSPMLKRWGRFGEFLACERYPECRYTRDLSPQQAALPVVSEPCPVCGRPMTLRRGRWGVFLACTGYPECKTTRRIKVENGTIEVHRDVPLEETCPLCQKPLARKTGRFGEYIGCTGYPACRYIRHTESGVACPEPDCGGQLVEKRTRRGRRFYGCSRYPSCRFAVWDRPIPRPCPKCGYAFVMERETKREGTHCVCPSCREKFTCEEAEDVAASPSP